MDCDGQHEPSRATSVIAALDNADIASGSRYLEHFSTDVSAPADRMQVNQIITSELIASLGLNLTDAFCGYKGYRIAALSKLNISETGWGMPLQVWVQAARLGLRIKELPVPRIYLDATRSFGTTLDNANERLEYYRRVIKKELINFPENHHSDRAPCKCMGNLI
jgi:dolichol-phosphate mannosyltransferase